MQGLAEEISPREVDEKERAFNSRKMFLFKFFVHSADYVNENGYCGANPADIYRSTDWLFSRNDDPASCNYICDLIGCNRSFILKKLKELRNVKKTLSLREFQKIVLEGMGEICGTKVRFKPRSRLLPRMKVLAGRDGFEDDIETWVWHKIRRCGWNVNNFAIMLESVPESIAQNFKREFGIRLWTDVAEKIKPGQKLLREKKKPFWEGANG